jgi:tetratricopeptide (TPR) repeat protein
MSLAFEMKEGVPRRLLLSALMIAGMQLPTNSFAVELAASGTDASASSADQLSIGHAYEQAGRFADAEAAYRRALEIGSPKARVDAITALSNVVQLRSASLLSLARSLEDRGRSGDAESVYLEVLKDGDAEARSVALNALARLSDTGATSAELKAAKALEGAKRWDEAEALYQQVIQSGSMAQKEAALAGIKELAKIRHSFVEEEIGPAWDTFLKALFPTLLVAGLILVVVVPVGLGLKRFYRRRYRARLNIGDFSRTEGDQSPGAAFRETLLLMHDRMSTHFRERTIVGDAGKMPALLDSSRSDVLDLLADVNESLVPFSKWFSKVTQQPGYRVSGWTEATWGNIKVCAKFEHYGKTVRQWTRIYSLYEWFGSEQDLAYEVLISVKEYTDALGA